MSTMKQDENDPKKVLTCEFRVSFASVFKPKAMKNGDPKYTMTLLFPKATTDISALKAALKFAAEEKWTAKLPGGLKVGIRDGDEVDAMGNRAIIHDGFQGCWFVNTTSKDKPGLVDQAMQPIIDPAQFYSGCYARATIRAFAYDNPESKGVAFGLNNIQKIRDGEPFSVRTKAEDDFTALASANPANYANTANKSALFGEPQKPVAGNSLLD